MLNQPTYDKLVKMRMSAMADAYRQQTEDPTVANLSFDERFTMVVDAEYWSIQQRFDAVFQGQRIAFHGTFPVGRKIETDHGRAEDAQLFRKARQNLRILAAAEAMDTQNAALRRAEIRFIDFTGNLQSTL